MHASVPASRTVGRRVIIVGDVHGCLEDLQMLLEAIARQDDIVIITGDITGKGPDVYGVRLGGCKRGGRGLERAGLGSLWSPKAQAPVSSPISPSSHTPPPHAPQTIDFAARSGIMTVRGNHDDRGVRIWREWKNEGVAPPNRGDFAWVRQVDATHEDYLVNIPFTIRLEAYGVVVVHGGLLPGVPLAEQDMRTVYTIRDVAPRHPPPFGLFSWARERRVLREAVQSGQIHVPPAYQLEALERPGEAKENTRPWAGQYVGPDHVIFGHASSRSLQLEPFATGIDTACVAGGYLSACILPALDADGQAIPDYQPLPPYMYQQSVRLFDGEGVLARLCMQPSLQPGDELDKAKGEAVGKAEQAAAHAA